MPDAPSPQALHYNTLYSSLATTFSTQPAHICIIMFNVELTNSKADVKKVFFTASPPESQPPYWDKINSRVMAIQHQRRHVAGNSASTGRKTISTVLSPPLLSPLHWGHFYHAALTEWQQVILRGGLIMKTYVRVNSMHHSLKAFHLAFTLLLTSSNETPRQLCCHDQKKRTRLLSLQSTPL